MQDFYSLLYMSITSRYMILAIFVVNTILCTLCEFTKRYNKGDPSETHLVAEEASVATLSVVELD